MCRLSERANKSLFFFSSCEFVVPLARLFVLFNQPEITAVQARTHTCLSKNLWTMLEQVFYRLDVLRVTQPTASKH